MSRASIDIDQLRRDTPGCQRVLHLNNAGAALMPVPVTQAITAHIERESLMGGYEAAAQQHDAIEQVYHTVARLIGARHSEIALQQNASRAWQQAFYALPFQPGERILTSSVEYASNYIAYLQVTQRTGAVVEVIPDDEYGQTSVHALRAMMDERVRLISITHVPTNGGLVNPAEAIGQIAREANVWYLLDACQSIGQLPLDVQRLGCDFLSATSRKYLRGPRGAGFLYVRQERLSELEPAMLDHHAATWTEPTRYVLRDDARRFETWEASYATWLGLGAAAQYALDRGLPWIWERVHNLAERLRAQLDALPGVTLQDRGQVRCGIVSFTVDGVLPARLCQTLSAQRIHISHSLPQSTLLDMRRRQLDHGVARASVHYYNTEAELDRFIDALRQCIHPH